MNVTARIEKAVGYAEELERKEPYEYDIIHRNWVEAFEMVPLAQVEQLKRIADALEKLAKQGLVVYPPQI